MENWVWSEPFVCLITLSIFVDEYILSSLLLNFNTKCSYQIKDGRHIRVKLVFPWKSYEIVFVLHYKKKTWKHKNKKTQKIIQNYEKWAQQAWVDHMVMATNDSTILGENISGSHKSALIVARPRQLRQTSIAASYDVLIQNVRKFTM